MNFHITLQIPFIWTFAMLALSNMSQAESPICQMDIVKMHAFHACEYFADQLHEEHYRMSTRQGRSKRDVAVMHAEVENLPTTETVHQHDFKTRYSRPTHLSIRHLNDAFLVMDYPYAKILRKHTSHRYKMMASHFHSHNGTLEKDHHEEPAQTLTPQPHIHNHRYHHHHRSHHLAQLQAESEAAPKISGTSSSTTPTSKDDDSSNQLDNTIHTRRTRNIHVAVSGCCRDLEKCIHALCPM